MFQKKMSKTLHQNRFLHGGKPFSPFLILIQNSQKQPKIVFPISLLVIFCRIQTKMSGKKPAQPQLLKLPKQSPSSNTSQAKYPSQIVLVSPVSLANHYVVSTIPRPNYERPLLTQLSFSSALVSPSPRAITPYTVDDPCQGTFFLHIILFEYHLFIPLTSYWVFPNIFCSIIPLITNISYLII